MFNFINKSIVTSVLPLYISAFAIMQLPNMYPPFIISVVSCITIIYILLSFVFAQKANISAIISVISMAFYGFGYLFFENILAPISPIILINASYLIILLLSSTLVLNMVDLIQDQPFNKRKKNAAATLSYYFNYVIHTAIGAAMLLVITTISNHFVKDKFNFIYQCNNLYLPLLFLLIFTLAEYKAKKWKEINIRIRIVIMHKDKVYIRLKRCKCCATDPLIELHSNNPQILKEDLRQYINAPWSKAPSAPTFVVKSNEENSYALYLLKITDASFFDKLPGKLMNEEEITTHINRKRFTRLFVNEFEIIKNQLIIAFKMYYNSSNI